MIISSLSTYLKTQKSDIKEIVQYYPMIFNGTDTKSSEILNKYFIMDGSTKEAELHEDKFV